MSKLGITSERRQVIEDALYEWLGIGRSTAPADFDAAEVAIATLYERAGVKQPKFVRLSSPQAAKMYSAVEDLDQVDSTGWCGLLTNQLKDDLVVQGKGFSMIGNGKLFFLDDRMDFNVRINAQGLPGVLLFPVSKLFEYNADQKLSKPVWRPRIVPRL